MARRRPNQAAQSAVSPATILTLLQLCCAASYWQQSASSNGRSAINEALFHDLLTQAREAGCSQEQLNDAEQYGKSSFLRGHTPAGIGHSPEKFAISLHERLLLMKKQ